MISIDGRPFGKRRRQLLGAKVRGHDDQAVDPAAHRAQRMGRLLAAGVQVGQQQQIAAAARFPVHAAHDLGEELAVQVGKHDADRIVAGKAEAAAPACGT